MLEAIAYQSADMGRVVLESPDVIPEPSDPKGLYRQFDRLVSRDRIRPNLERIVISGAEASEENPLATMTFWQALEPRGDSAGAQASEQVAWDEFVRQLTSHEPQDVVNVWDEIRRSLTGSEWRAVSKALAQFVDLAAQQDAACHSPGGSRVVDTLTERVLRLDRLAQTDGALDLLYDSIDDLLRTNRFEEVDAMFGRLKPSDFSADALLGFLTASLPARSRLRNREAFRHQVERILKNRGEWEEGLLAGL